MTSFRLDSKSAFHRKVLAAGNEAWGALCRAGAVATDEKTDGRVTVATMYAIAPEKVWARLVDVGLAERVDGSTDLQLHDFLVWNPSAVEREQQRAMAAERKRRWRQTRNASVTPSVTEDETRPERVAGRVTSQESRVTDSRALASSEVLTARAPAVSGSSSLLEDLDLSEESRPDPPCIPPPSPPSPTPIRSPRRSSKPVESKPPPHPRYRDVVDAYFVSFEAARGCKPVFGAADGPAVNRLLAAMSGDADRAIEAIRGAYADPFKARNATIRTIAADPSKYVGASAPSGRPVQSRSDAWRPRSVEEHIAEQETLDELFKNDRIPF